MTESPSLDLIAAEAADWFTAIRTDELSAEERARFAAWLETSPVHVGEYLGIAEVWGVLVGARAWPSLTAEELIAATRATNVVTLAPRMAANETAPPPPARTRWRVIAAAAAVVAITIAVGSVTLGPVLWSGGETYATARGEQRAIVLADGSVVQLNTLSRMTVRLSDRERRIELADGEAFFRVMPDPERPFRVVTSLATVRAVGTEFNVYSREDRMHVAVVEGRVQVSSRSGAAAGEMSPRDMPPRVRPEPGAVSPAVALGPREALEIEAGVMRKTASPPDRAIAWIQRRLVFENERLDRVVDEFNRYNARALAVSDPDLAALRISAVFDADDPAALVEYLARIQQVEVSSRNDVTILSRPPAVQ